MNTKHAKRTAPRVPELEVKTLAGEKARLVKGGPCPGTNTRPARLGSA